MEKIIARAKNYKFHSLHYVVPDEPIMIMEENSHILIVEKHGSQEKIHWACESLENLIEGLNSLTDKFKGEEIAFGFVPPEFVKGLENEGYKVKCEFVDFWIKDLEKCNWDIPVTTYIRPLHENEAIVASSITQSCRGQSRGFDGEDEEAIALWLSDDDNEVFAAIEDDEIVGICMMSTYKKNKETVAWLRELAVHPSFQRKGIGRSLAKSGLEWGKRKGATQSFLATDAENFPAINLYNELGYKQAEGRGEINIYKQL